MDITFCLTPQDVGNYRAAVRDRLNAVPNVGILNQHWVRAAIVIAISAALSIVIGMLVPAVTGAPLAPLELLIGFAAGLVFTLGMLWINHLDQAKKLLRSDGPTLSEHSVSVAGSGLSVTAPHSTVHYAWPIIQDVSIARGLVLLWLEPSSALAVPERAFKSLETRDKFISDSEMRQAEAKLPRAGSFA